MAGVFKFSFGPWNIHEGADPFGPVVRESIATDKKLEDYKKMGFDYVQFHDDDAVEDIDSKSATQIKKDAKALRKRLDKLGLKAEFVAPRLWEAPNTIDGGYTANDPKVRRYATERSKKAIDIAKILGTDMIVLWFAREGTYIREAKDSKVAADRILAAMNKMFKYNKNIRIAIEPKPNEPMDHTYIPTVGHALALGAKTAFPNKVGVVIESAHAILANLDPSDEMGFALSQKALFSVHLNDQNGLKFDQDKTFGSVDLRRAFNQVRLLDKYNYGKKGEVVGLDVKAMRTQKLEVSTKHLSNSRKIFMKLLKISRSLSEKKMDKMIAERDYEELDLYIMESILAK